MYITGADDRTLAEAAKKAGVRLFECRRNRSGYNFRLKTDGHPPRWGRVSGHIRNKNGAPRRIPGAVCWHGHRAFMRELFTLAPAATLKTALATYKGQGDFERSHHATAYTHSRYFGMTAGQPAECDCEDS